MSHAKDNSLSTSGESGYVLTSNIRPSPLDLGTTYQGAILEGSLCIFPANEIQKLHIDNPNGQAVLDLSPLYTRPQELIWRFHARTDAPGKWLAFVGFWTDLGKTSTHFSLEVKEGAAPGGRVLFCHSPFNARSTHYAHDKLTLVCRELEIQLNASNELPQQLSSFNALVLYESGLNYIVQDAMVALTSYLEAGGIVIILADFYYGKFDNERQLPYRPIRDTLRE